MHMVLNSIEKRESEWENSWHPMNENGPLKVVRILNWTQSNQLNHHTLKIKYDLVIKLEIYL